MVSGATLAHPCAAVKHAVRPGFVGTSPAGSLRPMWRKGTTRRRAHGAVAALAEYAEVALCQTLLLAVLVLDERQLKVNVGEHLISVLRGLCKVAHLCQEALGALVLGVSAHTAYVADIETYHVHVRGSHICVQLLLRNGQYLRLDEGAGHGKLDINIHSLSIHRLILRLSPIC